jgi:23S rRNA (uridine2552-2'-O)-methyltransferase
VLHGLRADALADARQRDLALVAVERRGAHLDQLVVRERAVDLRDHGVAQALRAQLQHRVQRVRACPQCLPVHRVELDHAESIRSGSMAKTSKAWLRRHVTDAYVRHAKAAGYRSRAAYKLLEIDARDRLLGAGMRVVDLGAAPGGWSQVAAKKVMPGGKVVAVDLLDVASIQGVTFLKGDFREVDIASALGGVADVVLSDMMPNITGVATVDQARAAEVTLAAIGLCKTSLKPGGAFLVKIFHGEAFDEVRRALMAVFQTVEVRKPAASRGESRENYLLARRLKAY